MKEILYIQAGNTANYIGTHFWNTQESYLASEDPENSRVDATISFRNESEHGTLCPRLLIFDWKDNFGTLARDNALGNEQARDATDTGLWTGSVQSIRVPAIERSAYHEYLANNDVVQTGKQFPDSQDLLKGKVRYWSDYSRLYHHPRSLHPVNKPSEWDGPQGNWGLGEATFRAYNEQSDLMEDSVRLFLEECDTLQGIHVTNDSGTYSGFASSFLTAFQDEYRKAPALVFPLLSGLDADVHTNDSHAVRGVIADGLYLRALDDIASLTIPLQPPAQWSQAALRNLRDVDMSNPYYASAIVAPYTESATLPTRLSGGDADIATLAAKLQVEGRSPFAELSGIFPVLDITTDALSDTANFSTPFHIEDLALRSSGCRMDVTRGFSAEDVKIYETRASAGAHLDSAQYLSRYHSLEYPLPTSFPSFLLPNHAIKSQGPSTLTASTPNPIAGSIRGLASLSSGRGRTALLFKKYAKFAETCLQKRVHASSTGSGIDHDELKELVNDLWAMHDNAGGTCGDIEEVDA